MRRVNKVVVPVVHWCGSCIDWLNGHENQVSIMKYKLGAQCIPTHLRKLNLTTSLIIIGPEIIGINILCKTEETTSSIYVAMDYIKIDVQIYDVVQNRLNFSTLNRTLITQNTKFSTSLDDAVEYGV